MWVEGEDLKIREVDDPGGIEIFFPPPHVNDVLCDDLENGNNRPADAPKDEGQWKVATSPQVLHTCRSPHHS